MYNLGMRLLLLLWAFCCLSITPAMAADPDVTGSWHGSLDAGGTQLIVQFDLALDANGNYTGTMISLSQNNARLPIGSVTFENDGIEIIVPSVDGRFSGFVSRGGESMQGTWSQSGQQLALKLTRGVALVAPPNRPQNPIPPYPYDEAHVTIPTPTEGVTLGGTLTTPKFDGPWPAVVLVSGSGGQDRDEHLFGHSPFLVLADYLTRHGIAVLRYDDRGIGKSTGDPNGTTLDFAVDAFAAHTWLRAQPMIDRERVGICGHSEGGLIGAILAAEHPEEIGFFIGLAPNGISGAELMPYQSAAIMHSGGASGETAAWSAHVWERFAEILASESDDAIAKGAVLQMVTDEFNGTIEKVRNEVGTLEGQTTAMLNFVGPWFRTFLALDPDTYFGALGCPTLILHGEWDMQVPAEANQEPIRAAFVASSHPDYAVEIVPGVNHLFQTCTTGSPQEYGLIEETMSPVVLERVAEFINEQ